MLSRLTVTILLCGSLSWSATALAQREHRVRPGQSLARIARRYDVSVANLAAANQLRRTAQLRPGQMLRIPENGVHYVARGETLAEIARDHDCRVADLRRINRLRSDALRVGQRIELPGFDSVDERQEARQRWGTPRNPGVVRLYRRSIDRHLRVRLVDSRRRARRTGRRRVQEMMRSARSRRMGPRPPARLIEILARISDHFGGREITIVSGYRPAGRDTRASSRHVRGHALDIRVRGVPNTALRDYIRSTFNNVGVGFYPRSHFVHVDVRDRNSYWVDWSGPGEDSDYQRRGDEAPEDASDEEIESTGFGDGQDEGDDASEAAEGAEADD